MLRSMSPLQKKSEQEYARVEPSKHCTGCCATYLIMKDYSLYERKLRLSYNNK